MILKMSDLKYEIQILTLPDHYWLPWEKFLTMHAKSRLIDPVTNEPYNAKSGFKKENQNLKCEFFKHCAHFLNQDFFEFSQHLVKETPNRTLKFPKVFVTKPRTPVDDNFAPADWVERRKHKKVIIQDIMDTK